MLDSCPFILKDDKASSPQDGGVKIIVEHHHIKTCYERCWSVAIITGLLSFC